MGARSVRPRWHDVMIVLAIIALGVTGVWALWWGDVRGTDEPDPADGSSAPRKGAPSWGASS